ncbi:MAG: methionyl-tRNA formyltransferase [Planctomycetes bacterium]|nr:methionyl-tRNA formyltransferase [Planctomycetota bacterium]
MRIAFFGTSTFAVPVLAQLARSRHTVALVVTRPDAEKGRGRKIEASPVATLADELRLPTHKPLRVNTPDSIDVIRAASPDFVVVVAYGQILKEPLLSLAPRGIVNLHGSLLPHLRGAAPIARAIQRGEATTGVSLQFLKLELDAGDVIDAEPMPILDDDTTGSLTERMAPVAAELLARNLDRLEAGSAPRTPQDESRVTFAKPLTKDEGRIDWSASAANVRNHVRAMTPWPGAHCMLRVPGKPDERIVLRKVTVTNGGGSPGAILSASNEFVVACGDGAVRIDRLLRAGKSELDAGAFLRGFRFTPGTCFS